VGGCTPNPWRKQVAHLRGRLLQAPSPEKKGKTSAEERKKKSRRAEGENPSRKDTGNARETPKKKFLQGVSGGHIPCGGGGRSSSFEKRSDRKKRASAGKKPKWTEVLKENESLRRATACRGRTVRRKRGTTSKQQKRSHFAEVYRDVRIQMWSKSGGRREVPSHSSGKRIVKGVSKVRQLLVKKQPRKDAIIFADRIRSVFGRNIIGGSAASGCSSGEGPG